MNTGSAPYMGAQRFLEFTEDGDYGDPDDRMEWFEDHLYDKAKDWLEGLGAGGIDLNTLLGGGYGI